MGSLAATSVTMRRHCPSKVGHAKATAKPVIVSPTCSMIMPMLDDLASAIR
jgi:hypothetical protein